MNDQTPPESHPIVLFDGVCNLCAGVVRWLVPRDPAGVFVYAALQSPIGNHLCTIHGIDTRELASVVLVHQGQAFVESDAALRIVAMLPGAIRHLAWFRLVPRPLRDAVYRWVARNRYGWFGQAEHCLLALPGYQERFISEASAKRT
jgi:predicted DCC family thiol-disulfide oxidoreductase YuxK